MTKGQQDKHQQALRAKRDPARAAVTRLRDLVKSDPDSPFVKRAQALIDEWEAEQRARKEAERKPEPAPEKPAGATSLDLTK